MTVGKKTTHTMNISTTWHMLPLVILGVMNIDQPPHVSELLAGQAELPVRFSASNH